jgi:hypothetical protein
MKRFVFFLLIGLLSGFTWAQQGSDEGGKKEATFVKESESAVQPQAGGVENGVKQFKIHQDGTAKTRKSKERVMMGPARDSGPAQKIKKKNVEQQPATSELHQLTSNQGKPKKRAEK